jgi:hypothetical protein
MSHQDKDGLTRSLPQHQVLKRAFDRLGVAGAVQSVRFRDDSTWVPAALALAALLWAWSDEKTLVDRFVAARKIVIKMLGLRSRPAASYQAFTKMLRKWTVTFAACLADVFRQRMRSELAERFVVQGFVVFGVDGSRLQLPRTVSNEERFSAARRSTKNQKKNQRSARSRSARTQRACHKKANTPQLWVTTMWHVGTGLPWDWRTGPADSSERAHWCQMLSALPEHALMTADAGFVGYDCWRAVLDSGRHLLVRVGANVRLLKQLGYARERQGTVCLWPDRAAVRCQPPLVLRLVVAHNGRHPVYLVTSVLSSRELSDAGVIAIYARRWGIELFYRHFKQTFERRKLRSAAADNVDLEATWSILGLWAMSLHAQIVTRGNIPPQRLSVARMLRAYRHLLHDYKNRPEPGESLRELLARAVIDSYKRVCKTSRDYPRQKQEAPPGAPEIRPAHRREIQAAQRLRRSLKKGLTA